MRKREKVLGKGWEFRGIMGEGKWGQGNGSMHFNFFVDIFSFLLRRLAQLESEKKLLDCSDSGRRILVTQVPRIGHALKLPKNDNKKKKITKNSHSHIEINQIYQSIHNLMRQAHKEMSPATAAALTIALVWSSIPCC